MPETALVEFLRKAKDTWRKKFADPDPPEKVHFVLGNESCDLDSVVSAVCLSYLHHSQGKTTIPLLNIPAQDLPLKTEVVYLFNEIRIPSDLLLFRDDVDLAVLHNAGALELTLVDHHVLAGRDQDLAGSVVSVVDHRPLDAQHVPSRVPPAERDVRVVGSCASLVAERILEKAPHLLDHQLAQLIRGTVLLDTGCFSAQADRTTPLDIAVVEACERQGDITEAREATFDRMVSARKDVSSLTSLQILLKDMKVVRGTPLPGMPLLVQDFVKRADAADAMSELCARHSSEAAVVMGMQWEEGALRRDLAVFSRAVEQTTQPASRLIEALRSEESLQLVPTACSVPGVTLFHQQNAKMSRKQVLPLVQKVLAA